MRRWPDFDPERVLFDDGVIIAVDKPAGVPSQESRPGEADDLPSRLQRWLADRAGTRDEVYLGIHQRLDQETSGVLVYARTRAANGPLARQFEGRSVRKTYVAAVKDWPHKDTVVLEDILSPRTHGKVHGRPADRTRPDRGPDRGRPERGRPDRGGPGEGARAITRVRVLERQRDRFLLELELITGRTHQARVQLAEAGCPIVGDTLYGGEPAPRLLLHARKLTLEHPEGTGPVTFEAPVPEAFGRWLRLGTVAPRMTSVTMDEDRAALNDVLATAREVRFALARSRELPPSDQRTVTAYRLVHEDADGVPGVAIDVYGEHLVLQIQEEVLFAQPALIAALEFWQARGIYLKIRPRQANTMVDARVMDRAPVRPIVGEAAPEEFEIREHGLPLLVRLGDGLSTGLFLDQRENRRRVREWAAGKRMLNLFAYTGAFTVAAAAGGAQSTTSVDASRSALERAERGLAHAGLSGRHSMVVDDVFGWVERCKERFDLIVLDPPSYSKVGQRRFSTASDYRALASSAMRLLAPGGRLLACSNHRQTVMAKFRRWLHEAARHAGRDVAQMKDLTGGVDHPPIGREPHLKSVSVTVR